MPKKVRCRFLKDKTPEEMQGWKMKMFDITSKYRRWRAKKSFITIVGKMKIGYNHRDEFAGL